MHPSAYEHRKSRIKLRLNHADGTPLAKQAVQIKQQRHAFLFGCGGFDAVLYTGGNIDGTPLPADRVEPLREALEKIFALCNFATLPFYLGRYEPTEGQPDERRLKSGAQWFVERNITVKGHPLCWHTACAPWLMDYPNDVILQKQLARIDRDVKAYAGSIDMWDVINEVVIMPDFQGPDNAITRVCKDLGRVGIIKEVFAAARQASPNATLLLNDYDASTRYEILIDGCLQSGIPIDAIGIQSHQHKGYWGRESLLEVLACFTHFGLPVHFTENTILSGELMPEDVGDFSDYKVDDWPTTPEGEERQAREMVEMYETLFADPAVVAVTNWDPTDGRWLRAPSGFLRKDNSIKPVYEALMAKIKGEWWTCETLVTDDCGEVDVCGFRGDYSLTVCDKTANFVLDGTKDDMALVL